MTISTKIWSWVAPVVLVAAAVAVSVVMLGRAKIADNEKSAVAKLRTLCTQENMFHKQDSDGNQTNDYWAIDVSGLYRVLKQRENLPVAMIDQFTPAQKALEIASLRLAMT